MALGKLGVWYGADKLQPDQWIDFVTTVERLGYDTQWYLNANILRVMDHQAAAEARHLTPR